MNRPKVNRIVLGKLLIAAVVLVALIAPLAKALAPGITWGYLVFYSLAGLAGMFTLLVLASVCSLQLTLPLESVSHNRDHELACLG